ncbi:MAG: response regulator transcription factor [Thermotogota bacterium]
MVFKVLLVEDDNKISYIVKEYLEEEGYSVDVLDNGNHVLEKVYENNYHLIILDWMLPSISGIVLCNQIRKNYTTPIIMLTAKTLDEDQIKGFISGADDYITKPFNPNLLLLRIKNLFNRTYGLENIIKIDNILIDFNAKKIIKDNKEIKFSPKEYDLLIYFIINKNILLSRDKILSDVWGYDFFGDERTVDTHVKMIRKKLNNNIIKTVRKKGYILEL